VRIALRVGLALLVLLLVALGALVVALPRLASSDAVRARITEAAREATGREVAFAALSFGLFPPRLVVTQPSVAGPAPGAPPALEAERIDLELSLLPLLARAVVVDSVVLEGLRLRLVRTRAGLELPLDRPEAARSAREPGSPEAGADAGSGGSGFGFAVGSLELRRAQLVLEDRSVAPAVTWELADVEGRARAARLGAPIELELSGRLASGGRLELRGTARLDGSAELELALAEVSLAPAAAYAGGDAKIAAGTASGRLAARGPLARPAALDADLVVSDAEMEIEDVAFQGRVGLKARLEGGAAGLSGPFELDATQARLRYGGFFDRPPGTEATAKGRLVPQPGGGFDVDGWELKIKNFEAQGRLRSGARTRLELEARPFALEGWGELVPALAPYAPAGELALEGIVVETPPLALAGRVLLRGLSLRPGDAAAEPVILDGTLVAEGTGLHSSGLVAKAGGQAVGLEVEIADLAGAPRYRVRASTANAEIAALLRSLTGQKGALEGPLTANADLAGPLGGDADPLRSLSGRARIDVGKGRIAGVSLLRGVMERLGAFAELAALAGPERGGALEPFYRDEFDSITGTFDLGGGLARTEDLRLVYRDYRVDLRGVYGLLDESLDFTGELTLGQALDAALAGEAPAAGAADAGAGAARGAARPKVIPLARVRGTLDSPRVELTREGALALASGYASGPRRERLEQKIDERLGQGSGKEVIDALEGLLGGRER
jgi:AsmA protein